MIGIDYESFVILSTIGSHYLVHKTKQASDFDAVWDNIRQINVGEIYNKKKLTIFAVASILEMTKETVRRKIDILKKKKLVSYTTKLGLLPT